MDSSAASQLSQHIEPLLVLSISHLSADTQLRLSTDDLSVNAYPMKSGGLIYVGRPVYCVPAEPDLQQVFKVASEAGAVWLKFDVDAAVIDGLPVFDDPAPGDQGG